MKNRAALPNRVGFYTLVMVAFSFIIYYMTVRGGRREIKYINNATDVVPYMQGVSKKGNPWLALACHCALITGCMNETFMIISFSIWHKKHVVQQPRPLIFMIMKKLHFIHPVINVQQHAKVGLPFFTDTRCMTNISSVVLYSY